ncbi:MFS transporter [Streptomyces sp. CC224B]|uniref:MFS transporter n=1 Tax=Streptomyces sp. CC224B TaxID=3044571 RepID=UPI0024A91361|nr:MFS transporter [Streptomyces sp. CC224B]
MLTLWSAQALSVFGDRLYSMAVMWVAWQESGAAAMGLVAVAESLPYIVLGTVGQRLTVRCASLRALAAVDLGRLVLVAALPLAWSGFGVPGLLVCALLLGAGGAVFDPNLGALVPELVEERDVQAVNGLMDLSGRIARVAGPGAAGLLLAVMPMRHLFWIDAATFGISALVLAALARTTTLTAPLRAPTEKPVRRPRARQLLRAHPDTAVALAVHGIGIGAGAVALAMPALLTSLLDAGPGAYGATLAAAGAGAVAANGIAGHVRLPGPAPVLYCAVWAVSGVLLAATGAAVSLPYVVVMSVLSGAIAPFLQITLSTHLSRFPSAARLRLMAVDLTVIRTAGTLSMLVVPAVAAGHPQAGFVTAGAVTAAAAAVGATAAFHWSRAGAPIIADDDHELTRE